MNEIQEQIEQVIKCKKQEISQLNDILKLIPDLKEYNPILTGDNTIKFEIEEKCSFKELMNKLGYKGWNVSFDYDTCNRSIYLNFERTIITVVYNYYDDIKLVLAEFSIEDV